MRKIMLTVILGLILIASCAKKEENTGIANPASVFCEKEGGKLDIVTDANGGQQGICTLKDGTTCEEWAYFRGECPKKIVVCTMDAKVCPDGSAVGRIPPNCEFAPCP